MSRSYPFCWVGHSTLTPWYWHCSYSPETQLPLKRRGVNSCPRISCSLKRWPLTLGPSSGGVSSTTDVTINASTMTMTSNAIRIPRQLRWLGLLDTNCWHKGKTIRQVSAVTASVGGGGLYYYLFRSYLAVRKMRGTRETVTVGSLGIEVFPDVPLWFWTFRSIVSSHPRTLSLSDLPGIIGGLREIFHWNITWVMLKLPGRKEMLWGNVRNSRWPKISYLLNCNINVVT